MKAVYSKCNNSNIKKIVKYLQHKGYITYWGPKYFIDGCKRRHARYIYGDSDGHIRWSIHLCDCDAEDISYIFNSNITIF